MDRKIIGVLQARSDSTRLPQKVLKNILDKPMIVHQLIRTQQSKMLDDLILVTSDEKSDNELAQIVEQNGYRVFRGSKNNVLKRFYDALYDLELNENDLIVRLTGDCPLHDARIIDESIQKCIELKSDYFANCLNQIYPDGLDVEVFRYKTLLDAYKNADKNSQLEHVTPYIRDCGKFKIDSFFHNTPYSDWRLTVDEPKDFELITKIFNYFGKTLFTFDEIVEFLNNNRELLEINNSIIRNEGYLKSLKEDG
jgi:spore coat polysaccharide biosynthesis protein SpsF (cytidylyltransferase family)